MPIYTHCQNIVFPKLKMKEFHLQKFQLTKFCLPKVFQAKILIAQIPYKLLTPNPSKVLLVYVWQTHILYDFPYITTIQKLVIANRKNLKCTDWSRNIGKQSKCFIHHGISYFNPFPLVCWYLCVYCPSVNFQKICFKGIVRISAVGANCAHSL